MPEAMFPLRLASSFLARFLPGPRLVLLRLAGRAALVSPGILFLKDTSGRYLFCNREFVELSGISGTVLLAMRDTDNPDPEVAAEARSMREAVLADGQQRTFDLQLRHQATRQLRNYRCTIVPVRRGKVGRIVGLWYQGIDITDELEMLQAERARADAAEHGMAVQASVLAAAGHDVRQPLQSAGLYMAALEMGDGNTRGAALAGMAGSLASVRRLLDNVFEHAWIGAQPEPRISAFGMGDFADELRGIFAPAAAAGGMGLRFRCSGKEVVTDRVALGRIVGNLVSNALRHSGGHGVEVSLRPDGRGNLVAMVSDDGRGMDDAQLAGLWSGKPPPERRPGDGLGLGIPIVRSLCALLGASLSVSSEPGTGTSVTVSVPGADPGCMPPATPYPGWSGLRVLVVDPARDVRLGTRTMLQGWGAEVGTCVDGDEATELASGTVRTDILLVHDGMDEAELRSLQSACGEGVRTIRMRPGPSSPGFLGKPVTAGDLAALGPLVGKAPGRPA